MYSILNRLYAGEIDPAEVIPLNDPIYRENRKKINHALDRWKERLTAEEFSDLEDLMQLRNEVFFLEERELFRYGVTLGAHLLLEITEYGAQLERA